MDNSDELIPPGEFEVEKILDYRKILKIDEISKKNYYVEEYLIKWLGYEEQTWEPVSNLDNCQKLLNDFKKKMKKKIPFINGKKNYKNKIPVNMNQSAKKVYNKKKKLLRSKEKLNEIEKIAKSCKKIQKPKKTKISKKNNLLQNRSNNAIKTKYEGINLKEEKYSVTANALSSQQEIKKTGKKEKNISNISNTTKENIIEYFDKNRYILYRCEIVEKPIFLDYKNSIPEQKINYEKITFNDIFPYDTFGKVEKNLGKKRIRNNSLNSLSFISNCINNSFTPPRAIKK